MVKKLLEVLWKRTAKNKVEKVTKKKCDKWYAEWKGHDNSFNSWIDKKYIII